jgi:hypothetical protein
VAASGAALTAHNGGGETVDPWGTRIRLVPS